MIASAVQLSTAGDPPLKTGNSISESDTLSKRISSKFGDLTRSHVSTTKLFASQYGDTESCKHSPAKARVLQPGLNPTSISALIAFPAGLLSNPH